MDFINKQFGDVEAEYVYNTEKAKNMIESESHEHSVIEKFVDEIEEDDVVWDIGANVGLYSVPAGLSASEVHSFEMIRENCKNLKNNARLNQANITVHCHALGNDNGEIDIEVSSGGEAGTGTSSIGKERSDRTVPIAKGDSLDIPSPDVIKLDTEGAEFPILQGMPEHIKSTRAMFIEYHPRHVESGAFDYTMDELEDYIEELGFKIIPIQGDDANPKMKCVK